MRSFIYKPTYKLEKIDYQEMFTKNGEHIRYFGFYKADEHILSNPPDHKKVLDKIIKLLKGTGISKIEIILVDKNLDPK